MRFWEPIRVAYKMALLGVNGGGVLLEDFENDSEMSEPGINIHL